ncbi:MAG: hypothetical protein JWM53_2908 [bacterium]|nr:hypothetical protein [bacterium]
MRSSTSSSSAALVEPTPEREPAPFFARALLLLAVTATIAVGGGHMAGRFYRPRALAPSSRELAGTDRFVVLFGNSHFEAGILPDRLAADLSHDGQTVHAQAFTGGGWDALHYYMLALLSKDILRPGRDLAVIEVCMQTLSDANDHNRLGVIRPEAAAAIAALPGAPAELRLDVLLGGIAGLYRYRVSLQAAVSPRLDELARRIGEQLHVAGELRVAPKFELVTMPGMEFVIKEVRGDRRAFQEATRATLSKGVPAIRVGGYKLAALERAVAVLQGRGIDVWLVETGTSSWYSEELRRAPDWNAYVEAMQRLAAQPHVHYAADWPASLSADDQFWDDTHRVGTSAPRFTDELAARIRAALR